MLKILPFARKAKQIIKHLNNKTAANCCFKELGGGEWERTEGAEERKHFS